MMPSRLVCFCIFDFHCTHDKNWNLNSKCHQENFSSDLLTSCLILNAYFPIQYWETANEGKQGVYAWFSLSVLFSRPDKRVSCPHSFNSLYSADDACCSGDPCDWLAGIIQKGNFNSITKMYVSSQINQFIGHSGLNYVRKFHHGMVRSLLLA